MLKIDEKVIFKHVSNREYAWELNEGKTYTIKNRAFDNKGEMFYGVEDENDRYSTWYHEKDFTSIKKIRKQKLQKLKNEMSL